MIKKEFTLFVTISAFIAMDLHLVDKKLKKKGKLVKIFLLG